MLCNEKSVAAETRTIRVSDVPVRNPVEVPVTTMDLYQLTRHCHANAVTVPTKSDTTTECSSRPEATNNFS